MNARRPATPLRAATIAVALSSVPHAVFAQSPVPEIVGTVDLRTTDGATMVGGPVEVLVGVVLLGAVTAAATALVVRVLNLRASDG